MYNSYYRYLIVWLFFSLWIVAAISVTPVVAQAKERSFFETEITQTQTFGAAQEFLKTSTLKSYSLASGAEINRFEKTQQFLAQVKREASRRYDSGIMSTYELRDFGREIEYLTHNMNEYFRNQSAFERTRNRSYRTLARQNLTDANMTYTRLYTITQANSRR